MPTFSTTIIDPLTQRPECLPVQEEAKGSTPLRIAINFIHPFPSRVSSTGSEHRPTKPGVARSNRVRGAKHLECEQHG